MNLPSKEKIRGGDCWIKGEWGIEKSNEREKRVKKSYRKIIVFNEVVIANALGMNCSINFCKQSLQNMNKSSLLSFPRVYISTDAASLSL